jgi:hypothetical protein
LHKLSKKINFFSHPKTLESNILKYYVLTNFKLYLLKQIEIQNLETWAKIKKKCRFKHRKIPAFSIHDDQDKTQDSHFK